MSSFTEKTSLLLFSKSRSNSDEPQDNWNKKSKSPRNDSASVIQTSVGNVSQVLHSIKTDNPILEECVWMENDISLYFTNNQLDREGVLRGPGLFVFYARTDSSSASLHSVKVELLIQPNSNENCTVFTDLLSQQHPRIAFRFMVEDKVLWKVSLSTKAIRKFKCDLKIGKRVGSEQRLALIKEYSVNHESRTLSKMELNLLDLQELPSYQRERVLSILDIWPPGLDRDIQMYPKDLVIKALARDSEYKNNAFIHGLIRPFLLLVSMNPEYRIRLGKSIGINLLKKTYLGDSHREAHELLFRNRKGIQARANHAFIETLSPIGHDCNWYQIIYRVTHKAMVNSQKTDQSFKKLVKESHKTFVESIDYCKQPNNLEILKMEELFTRGMYEITMVLQTDIDPHRWEEIEELMKNPALDPIVDQLRSIGQFTDEEIMRFFALSIMKGSNFESHMLTILEEWIESKQEGRHGDRAKLVIPFALISAQLTLFAVFAVISPLLIIPTAMLARNSAAYIFRETPGKLLTALNGICAQRVTLASVGICIKDFYPDPSQVPDKPLHDDSLTFLPSTYF